MCGLLRSLYTHTSQPMKLQGCGTRHAGFVLKPTLDPLCAVCRTLQSTAKNMHINLKGIAIGNGLVEPLTQYGAYADFAFNNGLISKLQRDAVNAAYTAACAPAIKQCQAEQRALRLGATPVHGEAAGGAFDCVQAVDICQAGCAPPAASAIRLPAHVSRPACLNLLDARRGL